MGGCMSSSERGLDSAASTEHTPQKGGPRQLGGAAAEDPREAMRAAALRRQEENNPGFEKAAKAELIGKLQELYNRAGKGVPFNLGALPLGHLRKLYIDMGGRN
jgi:hypothetical protein